MKQLWSRYWHSRWFVKWPIAAVVGLVLIALVTPSEEADDPAGANVATDPSPTEAPPARVGIESGTWMVGSEVAPGRYRSAGSGSCYWERLSGLSGGFSDILANDLPNGETVVDILPTDTAFKSERCGTWYADAVDVPITASPDAPFGDGTWIVGVDIAPGTWRGDGGSSCYWARLSDFTGELNGLITNDLPSGPPLVQIAASDAGFSSSGCGQWRPVQ